MLKRALACLLIAAALFAGGGKAVAVTLPWETEEKEPVEALDVNLDLGAMSRAVALASAEGLRGLRTPRQDSAHGAVAQLLRAAVRKMPWLGDGKEKGLWTWQRSPVLGVAIYGPGIGGYNSFSWTRPSGAIGGANAKGDLRAITQQALLLKQRGRHGIGPIPVPLPPSVILLGTAIAATAAVRRRRKLPG